METTCTAIVLARNSAHILRKKLVTTFEELLELHRLFPRNDIGLFTDPTGEGGDLWMYIPEHDDELTRRYKRSW